MDIRRLRGAFPHALLREADGSERRITVWCGNDYLGMGQNPAVLDAMKQAISGPMRRTARISSSQRMSGSPE